MTITWFGQSCFRIEAKEGNVLIDSFSKEIGLRPPRIKDDIVLVTHAHYDHNNTQDAGAETFIIDHPGEYERRGIHIQGIQSYHDKEQGAERGFNTVYVITAEEISVCHLGDLGQAELSDEQIQAIGDIDILMVPVGGTYTLDYKEAVKVIQQIEPKVIIPMHYAVPDLKIKIDGVEKFIKEIGLATEKTDKYKITAKTLPAEEMKLVVFQP